MDKKNKLATICVIGVVVFTVAFMLIYYSNKNEAFVYNQHLDEQIVTIKSKADDSQVSINMQEMAYYIINVEGDVNEMANQYSSSNPNSYWTLKIETTYTMRDYAKDLAMNSCIRDMVYYSEAIKNGVELSEEEEELVSEDANLILKNLSAKQMDLSDFSYEVLYDLEKKLYLSSKYVSSLRENGYTIEELELEGSYYEELLENYEISENEELWGKIKFGSLSVENK